MLTVTRHGRVEKVQGATESGVEWRGVEWFRTLGSDKDKEQSAV